MNQDKHNPESIRLLGKVDLEPNAKTEVWDHILQRIDDHERQFDNAKSNKNNTARRFHMMKTTAAAAAMLAIVGGGIGYTMHHRTSFRVPGRNPAVTTAEQGHIATKPAKFIGSPDWVDGSLVYVIGWNTQVNPVNSLYVSRNAGKTWSTVTTPLGVHIEQVDFESPTTGTIFGVGGKQLNQLRLYRTTNGGAGWVSRPLPTTLTQGALHYGTPSVRFEDSQGKMDWLFATWNNTQFPKWGIYHTTNDGQTWTNSNVSIGVESSGEVVVIHALNKQSAYFVDFCAECAAGNTTGTNTLEVSSDGGSSWTKIKLPFVGANQVQDLKFSDARHAIATVKNALMGQTLKYITTNGGHTWSTANRATNSSGNGARDSGLIQKTYATTTAAVNAVNSLLVETSGQFNPSGPDVNLGLGIKAGFSGGAGQYSYQWHEGRWTVLTQFWGNVTEGTNVAKSMVAYLHSHMLPAPQQNGIIVATQPSTSNSAKDLHTTIAWQVGNHVYELKQTGNPVTALKTVVVGGVKQGSATGVPAKVQVTATPNPAKVRQHVTIHVRLLTASGQGAGNQKFTLNVPEIINYGTVYTDANGDYTISVHWNKPGTYTVSAGNGKIGWQTSVVVK